MTAPEPPSEMGPGRWLLPAAFILLGVLWGSSFAWIKVAVAELPPATLVAERMTLGAIGMLVFLLGIAIVGLRYDAMVSLATRVARR